MIEKGWGQGYENVIALNRCHCVATAISHVIDDGGIGTSKRSCWNTFADANDLSRGLLGTEESPDVIGWNDTPGRTADEVYAAFDKAIALAESREASCAT